MTYPELVQLLADLNEAQVQFAAKVVGQAAIVVVEAEVGGAHLAHPQLLLLEAGRRHGVPVHVLKGERHVEKNENRDSEKK